MDNNKFDLEVIATGDFLDNDPGFNGKTYRVATRTIRLNPIAMNAYIMSQAHQSIDCFDSLEEYDDYIDRKRLKKIAFTKQVAEILGLDTEVFHVNIQQIFSEIFGICYITEE